MFEEAAKDAGLAKTQYKDRRQAEQAPGKTRHGRSLTRRRKQREDHDGWIAREVWAGHEERTRRTQEAKERTRKDREEEQKRKEEEEKKERGKEKTSTARKEKLNNGKEETGRRTAHTGGKRKRDER